VRRTVTFSLDTLFLGGIFVILLIAAISDTVTL
jgi:hypothetical protein